MKLSIEQVGHETARFAGKDEVIAQETGFVQRRSNLNGQAFVQALTFGFLEKSALSLNDLAQVCADIGVEITAQGLDQRVTDKAVAFLKRMFWRAMDTFKNQVRLPLAILQQFTGIYLTDSSVIPLPDSMTGDYPGCGGNGPKASMKVQLVFEFLLCNLAQVALGPGREPDQSYRDYTQLIPESALSITDLGYFVLDAIKAIMYEQKAYFLSRFLTRIGLLTLEGKSFNLLERLQDVPREPVEFPVLVGRHAKHQLPFRLIALPVPQEVGGPTTPKGPEKGATPEERHWQGNTRSDGLDNLCDQRPNRDALYSTDCTLVPRPLANRVGLRTLEKPLRSPAHRLLSP